MGKIIRMTTTVGKTYTPKQEKATVEAETAWMCFPVADDGTWCEFPSTHWTKAAGEGAAREDAKNHAAVALVKIDLPEIEIPQ